MILRKSLPDCRDAKVRISRTFSNKIQKIKNFLSARTFSGSAVCSCSQWRNLYICRVIICNASFGQLFLNQLSQTTALEWLGTVTGFLCVYLAARQNIWNWPVSIISVVSYAILFYKYHLFGDAVLQIYFLGTAIYGWYYWNKNKEAHERPVSSLNLNGYIAVVGAIVVLSFGLGAFLDQYTPSDVPYIDGTCTAISFVAQVLLTRKVLQNWVLWIIVDIMYVPLYLYKELALTAILYVLFLVIAWMGYKDWKKTWNSTKTL